MHTSTLQKTIRYPLHLCKSCISGLCSTVLYGPYMSSHPVLCLPLLVVVAASIVSDFVEGVAHAQQVE